LCIESLRDFRTKVIRAFGRRRLIQALSARFVDVVKLWEEFRIEFQTG